MTQPWVRLPVGEQKVYSRWLIMTESSEGVVMAISFLRRRHGVQVSHWRSFAGQHPIRIILLLAIKISCEKCRQVTVLAFLLNLAEDDFGCLQARYGPLVV